MTDREKLIELMIKTWDKLMNGPTTYEKVEFAGLMADHLLANGVTVQEWISVKDRLPECDQVVLCYKADRGVRIGKHLAATYADGVSAFKDCCRDYAFGATHWMPLPEAPKGE